MQPKYKVTLLAAAMSLSFLFGDRAVNFAGETLERLGWTSAHGALGDAYAQETPDDDDDDEEENDDPGGDGGDDDPGNDGAGDDPGGDDPGGDDDSTGDDGAGGDDDGPGGDDGGAGGDDDGPGGDDGGGTGGGDDDAPGGDDGGTGGAGGGSDDDGPGAGGGNNNDDDEPPGGAGVRGLDGAESIRIRDGDDDARGPSALPEGVDVDSEGRWVKAGEILALEADPTSLEFARGLGFQVIERHRLTTLGMSIVELRVPSGQNTREALEAVRRGDPDTAFDFNHVYESTQSASIPRTQLAQAAAPRANGRGATVGIVDTAIDTTHPALRGVRIQQVNFAGRNAPVDHGTAVASVLAGDNANHRLLAASVVERQTREGGELASADALVRALDWLAQNRVPVANISLAGPPNALVEDAVRRAQARGMIIVAAVGNDGPAAPPLYPAAYEGVVGVTAVDQRGGVYRRAGRGAHVDVAAPGVGVVVAAPGGRMAEASGTSYAAPTVAAALAQQHTEPDPSSAQSAVQQLLRSAADAGERGTDPVYGAGVVRVGQAQ
jgi:hypothetical protein